MLLRTVAVVTLGTASFAGVSHAEEPSGAAASPASQAVEPDVLPKAHAGGAPRALPCRPTIACTAEIVPAGIFEVEAGYAQRRAPKQASFHGAAVLAKYSLTDRFQLQMGSNNAFAAQSGLAVHGFDGAFALGKYVFNAQGDIMPVIAVSALVAGPTSSSADAVVQTWDADVWAYISKDIVGFHADLNLGADTLSVDRKPALQTIAALAISHDIAWGFGAMVEGYSFNAGGSYAKDDGGFLSALSYSPTPELVFDAGVDVALYRDTRTTTFFAGLTLLPFDMVRTGYRSSLAISPIRDRMTASAPGEP